ncbi:hypothetical protein HGH92_21990 [Chitinophaga varians]|uniref:Class I lanthipeptide n=1 Tax=Chitinophaga varians TaxID=2202339 RepID=A0A847S0S3_9BACT|nr:class I lanthipeptide [Chitinophaga varians]NLR66995.1 hypothetical protein [Chitinophaga varians]
MKKKKVTLSKKLQLKKDSVVELTVTQQAGVAGGAPLTRTTRCCQATTVSFCELC